MTYRKVYPIKHPDTFKDLPAGSIVVTWTLPEDKCSMPTPRAFLVGVAITDIGPIPCSKVADVYGYDNENRFRAVWTLGIAVPGEFHAFMLAIDKTEIDETWLDGLIPKTSS